MNNVIGFCRPSDVVDTAFTRCTQTSASRLSARTLMDDRSTCFSLPPACPSMPLPPENASVRMCSLWSLFPDGVPRTCKFTCPSQVLECRCMCHHNVFTTRTPCVDKLECKPGWTVTQLPGWHWTALLQSSDSHPSLRCFRKSESTHLAVLMQLSSGTLRFFVHPLPLLSQLIMNTPHLPFLRLLT